MDNENKKQKLGQLLNIATETLVPSNIVNNVYNEIGKVFRNLRYLKVEKIIELGLVGSTTAARGFRHRLSELLETPELLPAWEEDNRVLILSANYSPSKNNEKSISQETREKRIDFFTHQIAPQIPLIRCKKHNRPFNDVEETKKLSTSGFVHSPDIRCPMGCHFVNTTDPNGRNPRNNARRRNKGSFTRILYQLEPSPIQTVTSSSTSTTSSSEVIPTIHPTETDSNLPSSDSSIDSNDSSDIGADDWTFDNPVPCSNSLIDICANNHSISKSRSIESTSSSESEELNQQKDVDTSSSEPNEEEETINKTPFEHIYLSLLTTYEENNFDYKRTDNIVMSYKPKYGLFPKYTHQESLTKHKLETFKTLQVAIWRSFKYLSSVIDKGVPTYSPPTGEIELYYHVIDFLCESVSKKGYDKTDAIVRELEKDMSVWFADPVELSDSEFIFRSWGAPLNSSKLVCVGMWRGFKPLNDAHQNSSSSSSSSSSFSFSSSSPPLPPPPSSSSSPPPSSSSSSSSQPPSSSSSSSKRSRPKKRQLQKNQKQNKNQKTD